jgi:hypothetical protein
MSSWEGDNSANSIPKFAADLVKSGSGNIDKRNKTLSLFGNTTPNAFIPGTTKSMILVSDTDIKSGTIPVHAPGWYLKTIGSGGRSNRIQYECITTIQGSNPSTGMPIPPTGFRWDFVTSNNQQVSKDGQPVVALVRI